MKARLEILKELDTPHGLVELRSDNILLFTPDIARFKEYNLDVLKDLLEVFVEITDGIPRPYLCDNRYVTGIVNREEQAFINQHFHEFATRCAMLTNSSLINIMLNGYNALFKPKVEVRLFKSEEEAVSWLLVSDQ